MSFISKTLRYLKRRPVVTKKSDFGMRPFFTKMAFLLGENIARDKFVHGPFSYGRAMGELWAEILVNYMRIAKIIMEFKRDIEAFHVTL